MKKSKISSISKIIVVLLSGIVISFGFAAYSNLSSQRRYNEELLATIQAKMEYYLSTLDQNIRNMETVQEQYINHMDLNLLGFGSEYLADYDKSRIIKTLQKDLFQYVNANNLLTSAHIDLYEMERTVNFDFTVKELDTAQFGRLREQYISGRKIIYDNDSLWIVKCYPVIMQSSERSNFLIRYKLDQKKIQSDLEILCESSLSNAVLQAADGSWYIGSREGTVRLPDQNMEEAAQQKKVVKDLEGKKYRVLVSSSELLGIRMYSFVPQEYIDQKTTFFNLLFIILAVMALVIAGIYGGSINGLLRKPLKVMMDAFAVIRNGNPGYRIVHNREDEFAYLYNGFNDMLDDVGRLTTEVARQENLVLKAELRQLQYQIKPHFLYNSLYLIYRLSVNGEMEAIEELSQYLGGYYRYITRSSSQLVELEKEIEHCRFYIQIQRYRFGDRITVEFLEPEEDIRKIPVPYLILQPILENAYGHAVEKLDKPGLIRAYFEVGPDRVCFVAEDNGRGMDEEQIRRLYESFEADSSSEVTGIVNVHKRLAGNYGKDYGIQLEKSGLGGLKVTLRMKRG